MTKEKLTHVYGSIGLKEVILFNRQRKAVKIRVDAYRLNPATGSYKFDKTVNRIRL